MRDLSVVIPSHNEGANVLSTVASVLDNTRDESFEVVIVDDGSTDGSVETLAANHPGDQRVRVVRTAGAGVSRARNLGASHANGEFLVFLDAHCSVPEGWTRSLLSPLRSSGTVGLVSPALASHNAGGNRGYGLTWEAPSLLMTWLPKQGDAAYPVPLICGACQVTRRADFLRVGGYDAGMTRWGCEDHELSLRMWLLGYDVLVEPSVTVRHLFREVHPYRVEWYGVLFNILRMALLHMRTERVDAVIDHYRDRPELAACLHDVLGSDVLSARARLAQARTRSDDWWFSAFGVWNGG